MYGFGLGLGLQTLIPLNSSTLDLRTCEPVQAVEMNKELRCSVIRFRDQRKGFWLWFVFLKASEI